MRDITAASFYFYKNSFTFARISTDVDKINSSDGRTLRASASAAVDLDLIPSRIKSMTLKLVFTASLLDAQYSQLSL